MLFVVAASLSLTTPLLAGIDCPKLAVNPLTDADRGKGGVVASEDIKAMETIARIPRSLVLSPCAASIAAADKAKEPYDCWAAELTAAALLQTGDSWISSWDHGGWATNNEDLGRPGVRWGADDVTGSLLATGSDNDKNIYAKFRFPCHPVVHRAGLGLAALTKTDRKVALEALIQRGTAFRAMRDGLIPLVEEPRDYGRGSLRDRRSWDVADALSKVLSRATVLEDDGHVIVPLHERLAHCDERGENAKLVGRDPRDESDGSTVLLVATRDIAAGEAITRDYNIAPRLPLDESDGPLRLLLQFGLPPKAWGEVSPWSESEE